jgi:Tol biopolymer transport system component
MFSRFMLAVALTILMVTTGVATYLSLGNHQSSVALKPQKPTQPSPKPRSFVLPGTLYLAQSGAIYSLSAGRFHQLTPEDGWTQPSLFPDGSSLLAVKSNGWYSDVYVMNIFGAVSRQLTNNSGPARNPDTGLKHWSFYPRLSPDQGTLWMAYDEPKGSYETGFSIWAMPINATIRQALLWSDSGYYTGGDVQPIPLPGGGVMFTSYEYVDTADGRKLSGRLWFLNRPYIYNRGKQLTDDQEDCRSPSLSPDGTQVAMICTYTKQVSYLTIASLSGSNLGARKNLITNQMVAQPTWAPDGSGIAYLAPDPSSAAGHFQLWFLPRDAYNPPPPSPTPIPTPTPGGPHNGPMPTPTPTPLPTPASIKPIQLTTTQAFDATSPLAWSS